MKVYTAFKFLFSALAVVSVTACAKGGGSSKKNNYCPSGYSYRKANGYNNGYNNGHNNVNNPNLNNQNYNQNGYGAAYGTQYPNCYRANVYNNQYAQNNYQGQYGQQQQVNVPQQSTYPRPEIPVRIDRDENTRDYRRVSRRDTTVIEGELDGDEVDTDDRPSRPVPMPIPLPAPAPQPRIPQGPPDGLARVRTPQPQAPQLPPPPRVQTPAPQAPPPPQPEMQAPAPQAQPQVRPQQPAPPPPPAPEAQLPTTRSCDAMEVVYKDQLDSRNLSRLAPPISSTAYKAIIDEVWRRMDLQLGYTGMTVNPAVYPYSWKRGQHYAYTLEGLAKKLIETGACNYDINKGCFAVETHRDGSVASYYTAIANQAALERTPEELAKLFPGGNIIKPAVLRRDIINQPRTEADLKKLSRIEGCGIVVYSQMNSNEARQAVDPATGEPIRIELREQTNNVLKGQPAAARPATAAPAPLVAAKPASAPAPAATANRPGNVQLPGAPPVATATTTGKPTRVRVAE